MKIEPVHEISNNVVCSTSAQSDQSLCLWLEYSMNVKLLTEHHLEFLSLKGGCTGSSESTLVKMPNCWKSHALAQIYLVLTSKKLISSLYHKIIWSEITFYGSAHTSL